MSDGYVSNTSQPANPNPLDQLESKCQSSWQESLLSQSYRELPEDSIHFSVMMNDNANEADRMPKNLEKSRGQYFSAKGVPSQRFVELQYNSHRKKTSSRASNKSVCSGSYMMFPKTSGASPEQPAMLEGDGPADGAGFDEEEGFHLAPADKAEISRKIEQLAARQACGSKEPRAPAVKRQPFKQELHAFRKRNQSRHSLMESDSHFPSNLKSIFPETGGACLRDSKVFESRISDYYSFLPLHLIDWQPESSFAKLKSMLPSNFDLAFEIFWYLKQSEFADSANLQPLLDPRHSARTEWVELAGFPKVSNSFPCQKTKQPSFVRPIIKSHGTAQEDTIKYMAKVILAKVCAKKLATYSDLVVSDLDVLLGTMGLGHFLELEYQPSKWSGDCFAVFPDEKIFWLKNRITSDKFDLAEWVVLGGREIVSLKESWDVRQGRFFVRTFSKLQSRHLVAGVGFENRLHIALRLSPGVDCDNFVRVEPDIVPDHRANKLTIQASNKATLELAKGESLTIHVQESTHLDVYCSAFSSSFRLQYSPTITLLL